MGTRFWARFFLSFTSSLYYFNYEQIKGHEKSKRQSIRFTYIFSYPPFLKSIKNADFFALKNGEAFFKRLLRFNRDR